MSLMPGLGTSTKSAERLTWRAEKSFQFICANSWPSGSPFVLHPAPSAVSFLSVTYSGRLDNTKFVFMIVCILLKLDLN